MATWQWRSTSGVASLLSALLWLAVPSLAQSQPYSKPQVSSDYDPYFQAFSYMFLAGLLPEDDWRWWKAQCVQESGPNLKADARSHAGAVGVCQLMPATARDFGLDPEHRVVPRENIRAGALTLKRCTSMWFPRETRLQRLQLGWACYNSGGGHILKAQVRCGGAMLWEEISPCLPQITGKHARETQHYVAVIPRWYRAVTGQ